MVEQDRVQLMEDLAKGMMHSGYPAHYRESIIRSAVTGYRRHVEASLRGEKPPLQGQGLGAGGQKKEEEAEG